MENEEIMTEQISDEDLAAFDASFDDDVPDAIEAEVEATEATDESDTQHEEEPETDGHEEPGEDEHEPTEETVPETTDTQTYTIKHLREEKQVGIEEMKALASKGMDYDFVRNERDNLRSERDKLKGYEAFLKELAEKSGSDSIDEQIIKSRAMWLKSDEESRGNDISEADAILRVQRGGNQEQSDGSGSDADRNHDMFAAFIEEFPDVKAEAIPQEVWAECQKSGDLVGAYRKYENTKLKEEVSTLKKNQKNKDRSAGSRKTAGASTPKDPFDDGWDF